MEGKLALQVFHGVDQEVLPFRDPECTMEVEICVGRDSIYTSFASYFLLGIPISMIYRTPKMC